MLMGSIQRRVGELALQIPQTRNVAFYPSRLERGLRSGRAINPAMAEMYIQGVATRSVKNILEKLCGLEVSVSQESLWDKFSETVDILPWHVVRGCRLCRNGVFTGDICPADTALNFIKRTITDRTDGNGHGFQKICPYLSVLSPFKSVKSLRGILKVSSRGTKRLR